jgi:hypothetical protein
MQRGMYCILESQARLTLHAEPLRNKSKQEFTRKYEPGATLFSTNIFSWIFESRFSKSKCLLLRVVSQKQVSVFEIRFSNQVPNFESRFSKEHAYF